MVSGIVALILLLLAVIAIVVLTGKYRINAFLVLIGVSFVLDF